MRIAMFAWESLHSVVVGGVAVHITELAAALQRRGHEVHVFTRMAPGQAPYRLIDGVHYHCCPIDINPDFVTEMNNMCNSFVYFMGQTEAYQGGRFDVVHGHDWLCAKALVQARNDRGSRTVMTFHSTEYGRCGNEHYDGQAHRIRAIEAEGAYCADRLIAVSGTLAGELARQFAVPEWKLRVVQNGINCHRFDGYIDPAICRKSYGIGPLEPMVLFVGRITTQKGPDLLLEALPAILHNRGDAKIVFAGDGWMRQQLEHRAWQMGVAHAARFTGAMEPNGDIINLFKSSDVVCVPSRNEPFGIVILEAWAAGKPVVATRNGGPHELISHGYDGYLVYDNPPSICWGVNQIFANFDHARWMGQNGRAKAAYCFSWDTAAARTEAVYREIIT
jgi:glycosyltransferase involved in cell wall biosynthesis